MRRSRGRRVRQHPPRIPCGRPNMCDARRDVHAHARQQRGRQLCPRTQWGGRQLLERCASWDRRGLLRFIAGRVHRTGKLGRIQLRLRPGRLDPRPVRVRRALYRFRRTIICTRRLCVAGRGPQLRRARPIRAESNPLDGLRRYERVLRLQLRGARRRMRGCALALGRRRLRGHLGPHADRRNLLPERPSRRGRPGTDLGGRLWRPVSGSRIGVLCTSRW